MGASKLTAQERADRKRLAARIRQQRCRARKRKAERDATERAHQINKSKLTKMIRSWSNSSLKSTNAVCTQPSTTENIHHIPVSITARHHSPHSVALPWSFDEGPRKFSSTTLPQWNLGSRDSPHLCVNELTAIQAMLTLSNNTGCIPAKQKIFSRSFYGHGQVDPRQRIHNNEQPQYHIQPAAFYHYYSP